MKTMDRIADAIAEQFEYSLEDAEIIAEVLTREKVIRVDSVVGSWTLAHGTFWAADVMAAALEMGR